MPVSYLEDVMLAQVDVSGSVHVSDVHVALARAVDAHRRILVDVRGSSIEAAESERDRFVGWLRRVLERSRAPLVVWLMDGADVLEPADPLRLMVEDLAATLGGPELSHHPAAALRRLGEHAADDSSTGGSIELFSAS